MIEMLYTNAHKRDWAARQQTCAGNDHYMPKALTNGAPGESKRDGVDRYLHERYLFRVLQSVHVWHAKLHIKILACGLKTVICS